MAWLMPALLALLLGTTGLADQFHQALEASQQGRFAEALSLWDGVIELAPADSAAWSLMRSTPISIAAPPKKPWPFGIKQQRITTGFWSASPMRQLRSTTWAMWPAAWGIGLQQGSDLKRHRSLSQGWPWRAPVLL